MPEGSKAGSQSTANATQGTRFLSTAQKGEKLPSVLNNKCVEKKKLNALYTHISWTMTH